MQYEIRWFWEKIWHLERYFCRHKIRRCGLKNKQHIKCAKVRMTGLVSDGFSEDDWNILGEHCQTWLK
jgi:hypothetical protein